VEYWVFHAYRKIGIFQASISIISNRPSKVVDALAAYGYEGRISGYGERGLRPAS